MPRRIEVRGSDRTNATLQDCRHDGRRAGDHRRGRRGVAARIGVAQPHPQPPHYRLPNEDAFRHVAEAYGDDNPLWCDPDYATGSVWGSPVAPPHLNGGDTLIGENEVQHLDADAKALLRGDPIRGAHAYYAGSFREWWAPLRPGMRVMRRNALVGVHDKQSEFAARAVHEWSGEVFVARDPRSRDANTG